ncbi:prolactin-inducible protein [Talpa occidentalis]|uniref:prolactin-inducible protein n=1 Tax=Talpa occidentalis TaxID=50954 RepID=UPI0023F8D1F6|nr:prolactin-inducible protein [Talpa occidentalis]
MFSLQHQFRASWAVLLLVFCLQLGLNNAQTDTATIIGMNVTMPSSVRADELTEVILKVNTDMRECMVIKAYLASSVTLDGPLSYKYTACLCNDYPRTFFWDLRTNNTMTIAFVVDIVKDTDICPYDRAVSPITANRFVTYRRIAVY